VGHAQTGVILVRPTSAVFDYFTRGRPLKLRPTDPRDHLPGQWLTDATAALGASCKAKLAGLGEAEAAIRAPIEELLATAGQHLSLTVVPHDEVHDNDLIWRLPGRIRGHGCPTTTRTAIMSSS